MAVRSELGRMLNLTGNFGDSFYRVPSNTSLRTQRVLGIILLRLA